MPLPRRLALFLFAVLLFAAAVASQKAALRRRSSFPEESDLAYLPRTSLLRAISLGHAELMADLLFIRTITHFGTEVTGKKSYEWLPRHLDTIVELDPYFGGAYRFAGLVTMYNGHPITNESVKQSIHYLEAGLARFPSDWQMAFMVGCNYLFELQTEDAAERDRWRHLGVEWIRRAAVLGGPTWLPALAASIMTKEGETEASLRYLEEAYLTAPDDETREQIQRLLLARRESSLAALKVARDQFTAGWKREVPFAPPDLYVLLGDPPSPRLDWRYLVSGSAVARALAGDQPPEPATVVTSARDGGTP